MWQVPEGLAQRVRDADYADAWRLEIARTSELRSILTDLINELSGDDAHEITPDQANDSCLVCQALAKAEERLFKVTDDE